MAKRMRGLYKRGRVWWCCYKDINERVIRESTQTQDYDDAIDFLMKRRGEVKAGVEPEKKKIVNHPFNELVVEYKKWAERQRSFYSKIHLINQVERDFGSILLKNFNTKLLEQYQTERLNKGNKPSTVNRLQATLSHIFTKGHEWEMLSEETLKRIRKVKLLEENNRRLRYLSNDECQALINHCDTHLKPIVIMALNTGMRRGEVLGLKWDQVDLKHGFILLDITKNGERREIPINDTLRGILKGITRRLDIPWVFHDPHTGKPYRDVKRSFHTALKNAEKEKCSKCSYERQKTNSKSLGNCPQCGSEVIMHKGIKDFHFHDLRHTFASHLVMAGVDLTTVRELLGHKTLTMTLRYAHLAPTHKVKAVDILDKAINAPTSQLVHKTAVNG